MPFKLPEQPKCYACEKIVYVTEKCEALNRTWHKLCFKCGSGNDDEQETGCGKKLDLTAYVERKAGGETPSIPYCKHCYGKLFGPQGTRITGLT